MSQRCCLNHHLTGRGMTCHNEHESCIGLPIKWATDFIGRNLLLATLRVFHFILRYLNSGDYKNDKFLKNGVHYISSGRYKNENFLKNVVCYLSDRRYNGMMFLSVSAT
jgi:hypothetical protein